MPKTKTIVMSVGGSLVAPATGDGTAFLKKLKALLHDRVQRGFKFVIVVGGGDPARMYQDRLRKVGVRDDVSLDWAGIGATRSNAMYVAMALQPLSSSRIVISPKEAKVRAKIIMAAGEKPGQSSDQMAVQLAQVYGAEYVVNLSNVDYIYSADPKKDPNATRHVALNWKQMQKIVGTKWSPGLHTPFDPIATAYARKHDIDVAIIGGTKLKSLEALLDGQAFAGTWISAGVKEG